MKPVTVPDGVEPLGRMHGGQEGDLVLPGAGPGRQVSRADHRVEFGYAVLLTAHRGRDDDPRWWFFDHMEPALVFGRAGRSAVKSYSYRVSPAVREVRFIDSWNHDQCVLWVHGTAVDRRDDEAEHFRAWVDRVDLGSAHWPGR